MNPDIERLRIMDMLLSSEHDYIRDRKELRDKINSRLKQAKPATSTSLYLNLLTVLREKVRRKDNIEILSPRQSLKRGWKKGYCYSEKGYSYYEKENRKEQKVRDLILLAQSLVSGIKDEKISHDFDELVEKIYADYTTGSELKEKDADKYIQVDQSIRNNGAKWIRELLPAIRKKQTLEIGYEKFGKEEEIKTLCPYVLKEYRNRWYMVAYDPECERPQKTNVYDLSCINWINISDTPFVMDNQFPGAEKYFKYSLGVWHWHSKGPIKIRLQFVEQYDIDFIRTNPIHSSQVIISRFDPFIIEIEVYDSPELESMIRGYGNRVKVLSPVGLVDRIKDSAQNVLGMYA